MASLQPLTDSAAIKPERFYGFDLLRGIAMLLGIVLHAAITYMHRPMDGLLWALSDQPKSFTMDALFWWIHGWRIPLFFVMAGFFAAMLARRRGPGGFIRHRVQRILIPVAIATVALLPILYFIWGWGWVTEGRATWDEVFGVHFKQDQTIQDSFRGPAHLWFLNYLFVYSVIYWLVLKVRGSRSIPDGGDEPALPGPVRWVFTSPMRPLLFAVPTCALLAANPDFYLGYHHQLPESVDAWLYEAAKYVYQGVFFVAGIYLYRLHRDMEAFKRYAWLYLALAHVVLVVGALFSGVLGIKSDDPAQMFNPDNRWVVAITIALFCWLMIWGLIGVALTVLARPRAWVRWLSDSAYWVYLVHLPIVGVLMVWLSDWSGGPLIKFAVIVAVTSVITLASYQWGVRYTPIGWLLNGKREKPPRQ